MSEMHQEEFISLLKRAREARVKRKENISWLTKAEEEKVKKALIDFVCRVTSHHESAYKTREEVELLPQILYVLLNNTVEIREGGEKYEH